MSRKRELTPIDSEPNVVPFPRASRSGEREAAWEHSMISAAIHLERATLALEAHSARAAVAPREGRSLWPRIASSHGSASIGWGLGAALLVLLGAAIDALSGGAGLAHQLLAAGFLGGAALLSAGAVIVVRLLVQRSATDASLETVDDECSIGTAEQTNRLACESKSVELRPTGADRRLSILKAFTYHPLGEGQIRQVMRRLVLAAAYENGGRLDSSAECQSVARAIWGLELESFEVSQALSDLSKTDQLLQEEASFALSSSAAREFAQRIRVSSEAEAAAFDEWEGIVRSSWPSLGNGELAQLREDLHAWTRHLVVDLGPQAAILLYPEQRRFADCLERVKLFGYKSLPQRDPQTMQVRPDALGLFVGRTTATQRGYLSRLTSTAYSMSALLPDRTVLDSVRGSAEQRLYLDTNVIHSLLKLRDAASYAKTRRVVTLSRRLGYQCCVTPWALTELHQFMGAARRGLERRAPSPADIESDDGLEDANVGFLIRAFRNVQRSTGIDLEEFFSFHDQPESLLALEGVEVVPDGCEEIDHKMADWRDQIATIDDGRDGPEHPLTLQGHDVKHRLLISRLRGRDQRSLANAGALMLTNDTALLRYAKHARSDTNGIPFALSVEDWMGFVRALTPRTDDYQTTVRRILDTPSIGLDGLVSQAEMIAAIERIGNAANVARDAESDRAPDLEGRWANRSTALAQEWFGDDQDADDWRRRALARAQSRRVQARRETQFEPGSDDER